MQTLRVSISDQLPHRTAARQCWSKTKEQATSHNTRRHHQNYNNSRNAWCRRALRWCYRATGSGRDPFPRMMRPRWFQGAHLARLTWSSLDPIDFSSSNRRTISTVIPCRVRICPLLPGFLPPSDYLFRSLGLDLVDLMPRKSIIRHFSGVCGENIGIVISGEDIMRTTMLNA